MTSNVNDKSGTPVVYNTGSNKAENTSTSLPRTDSVASNGHNYSHNGSNIQSDGTNITDAAATRMYSKPTQTLLNRPRMNRELTRDRSDAVGAAVNRTNVFSSIVSDKPETPIGKDNAGTKTNRKDTRRAVVVLNSNEINESFGQENLKLSDQLKSLQKQIKTLDTDIGKLNDLKKADPQNEVAYTGRIVQLEEQKKVLNSEQEKIQGELFTEAKNGTNSQGISVLSPKNSNDNKDSSSSSTKNSSPSNATEPGASVLKASFGTVKPSVARIATSNFSSRSLTGNRVTSESSSLTGTHSIRQTTTTEKPKSLEDKLHLTNLDDKLNRMKGFLDREKELKFNPNAVLVESEKSKKMGGLFKAKPKEIRADNLKQVRKDILKYKTDVKSLIDNYPPNNTTSSNTSAPEIEYLQNFLVSNLELLNKHPELKMYAADLLAKIIEKNISSSPIIAKVVEIIEHLVLHEMDTDAMEQKELDALKTEKSGQVTTTASKPPTPLVSLAKSLFQPPSDKEYQSNFLASYRNLGNSLLPTAYDINGKEFEKGANGLIMIPKIKIYGEKNNLISDVGAAIDNNLSIFYDTSEGKRIPVPTGENGKPNMPTTKIFDVNGKEITGDRILFIYLKESFEKPGTSIYEKHQILNLTEQWLNDPFINSGHILKVKENINDLLVLAASDTSPLIKNLANNLAKTLDNTAESSKPVSQYSEGKKELDQLFDQIRSGNLSRKDKKGNLNIDYDVAVKKLASSVKAQSVHNFKGITSAELNNAIWTKKNTDTSPNIINATAQFNLNSEIFSVAILGENNSNTSTEEKQKETARVIEFLINVESELMSPGIDNIVDLNGAMAINSAFVRGPIKRLLEAQSPVLRHISSELMEKKESYGQILSEDLNYKFQKAKIDELKKEKVPVVPYLGLIQTEILMIVEKTAIVKKDEINPNVIKINPNVINMGGTSTNNVKHMQKKLEEVKNDDNSYKLLSSSRFNEDAAYVNSHSIFLKTETKKKEG